MHQHLTTLQWTLQRLGKRSNDMKVLMDDAQADFLFSEMKAKVIQQRGQQHPE